MLVGESAVTELPKEIQQAVLAILKRGNTAEIKRELNNFVVVEIDRKVKEKTAITG